tara:strand:+ start:258 stop:806 length:549 start_codon:yes stop_codon:yes gene_type:complete
MNFIFFKEKAYSKESCEKLINWFEENKNLSKKGTAGKKYLDNLEIPIEVTSEESFYNLGLCLEDGIKDFKIKYPKFNTNLSPWELNNFCQLCRFLPNKYYNHLHCEQSNDNNSVTRVFAWMIYLNDIDEGGETEFVDHTFKTNPKAGNLYIWPAGPTHLHKGVPCSIKKYFLTGWINFKLIA